MNDPLDERISRHLYDQTSHVDVGAPSMVHVRRRAHQRRNRRRTAFGVAGTAAVSAATIFGIQALSRPHTSRLVPARPIQPSPESGFEPAIAVPSNLVWNRFEPDSTKAIVYTSTRVAVDGGFLAWSTQPGRSNVPTQVLYRSDDGVTWERVRDASVDEPSVLAAGGGRLYSFGTAPATAAGLLGKATVGVSADDAVTWQQLDLPIDLGDLSGLGPNVQAAVSPVAFAAGDHGAIAVVQVTPRMTATAPADLRSASFTADGVVLPDECSYGAASTTTSIDDRSIIATTVPAPTTPAPNEPVEQATTTTFTVDDTGPATTMPGVACPTTPSAPRTRTWADLGVDPATAAIFAQPAQVFASDDGEHFAPAGTLPAMPAGYRANEARAIATTDGYAILRSSYSGGAAPTVFELLTSPDGVTWTSTQLPAGPSMAFGQLADGSLAAFGYDTSGPIVMLVRDGTVRTISLAELVTPEDGPFAMIQPTWTGDVSGAGTTLIAGVTDDPIKAAGQPSTTRDGVTLTLLNDSGAKRFTDAATGADLRMPTESTDAATGWARWDITATDGSVVTFTGADVQALWPQTSVPNTPTRMIILHSDDGIAWSRDDLGALSGISEPGTVNVMSTGNEVIVSSVDIPSGTTPGPDDPPRPTIVLVGTPKR
ncbi:MAG: hypothetical protein QM733_07560 [Ilumatobacteraceae bacterium]